MIPSAIQLLSNVSAQGNGPVMNWQGGQAVFEVIGTMGGATVSLQVLSLDGSTWEALSTATTVTAAGIVSGVNAPPGAYRVAVTAANPTGLFAALRPVVN